jgi:GntR family transcriptional regulator, transcriptional repressor for pyruvate dehydrogenase complex
MEIVEELITRRLQPGDRLPSEADMLAQFDVGRASLREGLRLLETYGVLAIRTGQGGGPGVTDLSPEDLARTLSLYFRVTGATYGDIIEARMIIDPVVAKLAAERNDVAAQSGVRAALRREALGESGPRTSYDDQAGADFHRAVTAASGNPVLIFFARSLRLLYAEHLHRRGVFPQEVQDVMPDLHAAIGQAIFDGDGDRAQNLMLTLVRDFATVQRQQTPWLMDERVNWIV